MAGAANWSDVVRALGLQDETSKVTLRGHAVRLGIEVSHLEPVSRGPERPQVLANPARQNLKRSGNLIAAAWFTLCGHEVSWPLEPARYDLLVTMGEIRRVHVKTTTVRAGQSWTVWLSTTGNVRKTYDIDEIDYFFVIDGDVSMYLIPTSAVGGLHAITLSGYERYRLTSGFRLPA